MRVNLKVWRQADAKSQGGFVTYSNVETTPDTSFLETLDILNESLVEQGQDPVERGAVARPGRIQPHGDIRSFVHRTPPPVTLAGLYRPMGDRRATIQRWQCPHQTLARWPMVAWRSRRPHCRQGSPSRP